MAAAPVFDLRAIRSLWRVTSRGELLQSLGGASSPSRGGAMWMQLPPGVRRVLSALGRALAIVVLMVYSVLAGLTVGRMGMGVPQVLAMAAVSCTFVVVIFGMPYAISTLYLSKDVSFYLALPIPVRTLLTVRLGHFVASCSSLALVFAAFGAGALFQLGAPVVDYLRLAVLLPSCAVSGCCTVLLILMLLMRLTPLSSHVETLTTVLSTLFTVAIVLGSLLVGPLMSDPSQMSAVTSTDVPRVLATVFNPGLLALEALAATDAVALALAVVLLLALSCALFLLALRVGDWAYLPSARALQMRGGSSAHRLGDAELVSRLASRPQWRATLSRDLRCMVRNPVFFNQFVISSLLMPLVLLVSLGLPALMGLRDAGEAGGVAAVFEGFGTARDALLPALALDGPIGPWFLVGALAAGALLCGVLAYATAKAVSRDGADFDLIRSQPVDWRQYVSGKLLAALIVHVAPTLVLLSLLNLVLAVVVVPAPTAVAAEIMLVLSPLPIHLAAFAYGAVRPMLDWENEAELSRGVGASVLVWASMLLAPLTMAPAAIPLLAAIFWSLHPALACVLSLALLVGEAALAWRACMAVSVSALSRPRG